MDVEAPMSVHAVPIHVHVVPVPVHASLNRNRTSLLPNRK